jgi:hypothetical protein
MFEIEQMSDAKEPMTVPTLLRAILSEIMTKSADLSERWVGLYFRIAYTFGVEAYRHQSDYLVDLILRKMEDETFVRMRDLVAREQFDMLPTLQYTLSRMWVLSTYEVIRLAQETDVGRTHAKLKALRRRIEMVRVPLAKQEIANDQRIKDPITLVRVGPGDPKPQSYSARDPSPYYPPTLGETATGSTAWRVLDSKTGQTVDISRRALSDEMLALFS